MERSLWNILLFLVLSICISKLSAYLKYRKQTIAGKDLLIVDIDAVLKQAVFILNDPDAPRASHLYALEMLKETSNPIAKRKLADALFSGTWKLDADYQAALKLYEELADNGDAHALYMLGIYHAEGIIHQRDFPKALAYLTYSAKENCHHAQLTCAYLYSAGVGVKADPYIAKRYLLMAAESVVQEIAKKNMRPLRQSVVFMLDGIKQPSRGRTSQLSMLEFYKFSSGDSSPEVLMTLGQIYYYGNNEIDPDFDTARKYFEMAQKKGSVPALGFLGQMYFRGEGVEQDRAKAFQYFREGIRSTDSGSGAAFNGMGLCYMNGIEVTQDNTEALEYFLKAIQHGSVEAMYNAAILMLKDNSPIYRDVAIDLLMNASKNGFLLANVELARLHSGNDRLHNLCLYLLRTFFERYEVTDLLQDGVSFYKSGKFNQAQSRFLLLSYQGFETAQYNTAFIYQKWSKRNHFYAQRAAAWYYRAAQGGDKIARVRLGDVFYYGIGLDKPYPAAAMANYLISMNEKCAEGAYSVGYLYERGIGVPKDFHMARLYYEHAYDLDAKAYWPIQLALLKLSVRKLFDLETMSRRTLIILTSLGAFVISFFWILAILHYAEGFIMQNIVNRAEERAQPEALHPVPLPATPESNDQEYALPEEIPLLEDVDH